MRSRCLPFVLLFVLWGCSPPEQTVSPVSPSPVATATAVSSPALSASPSPVAMATPLLPPDLPSPVFQSVKEVPALKPEMRETETWWADSGITENRLGYYASDKSVAELEKELLPAFQTEENRPYLEGIPAVFDFEKSRVCLMRRGDTDFAQMFMLVPLGDPPVVPASLKQIKLPPIPASELQGHKTLVVLATGFGLGEHVDHMLASAGLSIDPTSTPEATPAATP